MIDGEIVALSWRNNRLHGPARSTRAGSYNVIRRSQKTETIIREDRSHLAGHLSMASPLKKEFEFYLAHQDELVRVYNGKFIVIKGGKVLAAYDDELNAIEETQKEHPVGTFLVQRVAPGSDSYSQSFHSRVAFS